MSAETASTNNDSRHVFISFASADLKLANRIVERLERGGIRCWIAHRDIEPAASYPAAITAAMTSSAAVLLLLTESSNGSPHVLREIEMAFNARTPILPMCMTGLTPSADLQYFLSTTQWFDAGATFDEGDAKRLQERLKELLAGGTVRRGIGAVTRRFGRRTFIAGVLALSATAVIVLSFVVPWGFHPSRESIQTKANSRDGQTYVWVQAGDYVMGCSSGDPACEEDEKPAHRVRIKQGYWFARTEVTEAQYRKHAPAGSGDRQEADANLPATEITWAEAKVYCTAIGGRLPTEAEWEYAARAGTTTRYYGALGSIAWYEDNSNQRAHPVGQKQPNAFGLYDMLGNVAEWVRDHYYNSYDDSGDEVAIEEPLAPNASAIARGGSWFSDARGVRVSRRLAMIPEAAEAIIGFRCAYDKL
jgi:formylglycine-generating enzyme required for sulfatase activity